ncbi:MAG: homoserine dehydrogenase [Pseudomonadota bacterium]
MTEMRVAIAGLGTVGTGLLRILGDEGADRAPKPLTVTAVSARNRSRDRGVDLSEFAWFDDPVAMAGSDQADVFVELIGGEDGVAKAAVEAALKSGKHVVTANKALMCRHGLALAQLAEDHGVALRYEAAVAGGVPIVRGLRDGLAQAQVLGLMGVLNGTCNFILSQMNETGASFEDALLEAQRLGFAEADPTFDIGGIDAAHKLVVLTALAFDAMPTLEEVDLLGIDAVTVDDISAADEMGLTIKLVAEAARHGTGLSLRVGPALLPIESQVAQTLGSDNIVIAEASPVGRVAFSGPGAGGGATATAVAADLVTIARGATGPVFSVPAAKIDAQPTVTAADTHDPYFLRLRVADEPGVLAQVTNALAEANVSVDTIHQAPAHLPTDDSSGEPVDIVITTHLVPRPSVRPLLTTLEALPIVHGRPSMFPILTELDPSS